MFNICKEHFFQDISTCVLPFVHSRNEWFKPYSADGLFGQYKMRQETWKMTETLAYGDSADSTQWELSNEYQHDRV